MPNEASSAGTLTPEAANMIFLVTFMVMMLFFFMTGAAGEKYHPPFGHETSYTIAFGIIVSLLMWLAVRDNQDNAAKLSSSFAFKPSFFFDFLLPPPIL